MLFLCQALCSLSLGTTGVSQSDIRMLSDRNCWHSAEDTHGDLGIQCGHWPALPARPERQFWSSCGLKECQPTVEKDLKLDQ